MYRLKVLESPHWSIADKLLAMEVVTKDYLEVRVTLRCLAHVGRNRDDDLSLSLSIPPSLPRG